MSASETVLVAAGPQLRLGKSTLPIVLPRSGDPRLHVAAVIISIHVLGQIALEFRVSVPQILTAIGSCAVVEVAITIARQKRIVWPASAMLTGSGVALILRDVGTEAGDHWTMRHWWLFAAVAVGSLLSKYLIRWNGSHVFNPSNLGLVVAFLLLGSGRVEPLDFWWGPFDIWMLLAYWILIAGGLLITERLNMLEMVAAFWLTFTVAMAALAIAGHCFTAPWSITPVCDARFWWIIVSSPELLVFVFFMISDPRTVPAGRRGRIGFAVAIAVVSSLLIAPQTTEFGAKVGLLGGLVLVCAARGTAIVVRDRFPRTVSSLGERFKLPAKAVAVVATLVVLVVVVPLAGFPARSVDAELEAVGLIHPAELVPHVDPARVPAVTSDPAVAAFGEHLLGAGAGAVGIELVRALDIEVLAFERSDPALLAVIDHGARLEEMTARLTDSTTSTTTTSTTTTGYRFERMHLTVVRAGGQVGNRLAIEGEGVMDEIVRDADGAVTAHSSEAFDLIFALRPGSDDRWFIVDVSPVDDA